MDIGDGSCAYYSDEGDGRGKKRSADEELKRVFVKKAKVCVEMSF